MKLIRETMVGDLPPGFNEPLHHRFRTGADLRQALEARGVRLDKPPLVIKCEQCSATWSIPTTMSADDLLDTAQMAASHQCH